MPAQLEVEETEQRKEVTDVEVLRSGVNPGVYDLRLADDLAQLLWA